MALNRCFQYWANQTQDKEAQENVVPGVVLVEKTYSSEQLTQITLNFEKYGEVIYEGDVLGSVNNPYAITTPDEFIDKTMYFINSDNLIFTKGGVTE